MRRRVAITGIGVVSPLGSDLEGFCNRLLEGVSGAGPITIFDPASLPTRIAAEVGTRSLPLQTKDRKIAFGIIAARSAVEDADRSGALLSRHYPVGKGGLSLGIGLELFSMPDMIRFLEKEKVPDDSSLHPLTFLQTPSDICVPLICKEHRLNSPPFVSVSACAASTDALGTAFRAIQEGERAWMLAGGTDSMINPLGVGGFCKLSATTTRNDEPQKASRPFDRDRDGFLMGEGAAFLVLEPLEEAKARGARIYAEVLGYGNSFDAHGISEPHPEGEGALLAMQRALSAAGVRPEEVVHVNAHGTGTPKNDPVETLAIRRLLGKHAESVTVHSTKAMLGHLIAASGAVEMAALVSCGARGWLHPTINLENPDPACDLDYIPGRPRKIRNGVFLKNSFGFGGQNASLVLRM